MMTACRACLLTTGVQGTVIDENHLCDYCAGRRTEEWAERFNVTEKRKALLRNELERILNDARGKAEYDCVLALSGGKDSAYLLYDLVCRRKMKVLGVHINLPFESKIAAENIKRLRNTISFDLQVVDPDEEFYFKFYRTLFHHPVREGYVKTICYVCGPMNTSRAMKVATERKIPLVIIGVSPFQPENMFFEMEKESVEGRDWIPDLFKTADFDEAFRSHFWDPSKFPTGTVFPRVIAPLHVMDYNTEDIINMLAENDLIPRKKSNPAVTNCALNWPMICLDTKLLGYNPYLKEFATLVRKGQSSRKFWKTLLFLVDLQIRLGIFKKREIRRIESALGIKFGKCVTDRSRIEREFQEYP